MWRTDDFPFYLRALLITNLVLRASANDPHLRSTYTQARLGLYILELEMQKFKELRTTMLQYLTSRKNVSFCGHSWGGKRSYFSHSLYSFLFDIHHTGVGDSCPLPLNMGRSLWLSQTITQWMRQYGVVGQITSVSWIPLHLLGIFSFEYFLFQGLHVVKKSGNP